MIYGLDAHTVRWCNRIPRKQECQLLVGLLAHLDNGVYGDYDWRVAQGVEMGRPSELRARARKQNGVVTTTWIGGNCIQVAEGNLHV